MVRYRKSVAIDLAAQSTRRQPKTIAISKKTKGRRAVSPVNPGCSCMAVIPGWSEGPDPESRDSGFDAFASPRNDGVDLPYGLNLCSPDVGEERVDFRTQHVGFAAQRAGRAQHLARRRSGFRRGGRDADDVAGNLGRAPGGVLDVAGDL